MGEAVTLSGENSHRGRAPGGSFGSAGVVDVKICGSLQSKWRDGKHTVLAIRGGGCDKLNNDQYKRTEATKNPAGEEKDNTHDLWGAHHSSTVKTGESSSNNIGRKAGTRHMGVHKKG